MKSNDWQLVELGKEIDLLTGNPFKSSQYSENPDDVALLRGDNIAQGYLRWDGVKRWSIKNLEDLDNYFLKEHDIVLAMDRPWIESGLKYAYLSNKDLPCLLVQRVSRLRAKERLNQIFLRYVIGGRDFTKYILGTQTGTAIPHISSSQIKDFSFLLPPLEEQKQIADVLSCLDAKIENLRRQNETLEQIAQTLFKHWFIDFEFPNADGKPYKSSGDAMVASKLGDIPEGWKVGKLGDIIVNFDRQRIPLSSNERQQKQGIYPYHGATSIMDYIDDYLFDGLYVLMGEDGTVIDDQGYPVLQYVFGKFWVNNHAHVLQGANGYYSNFIYLFLKRTKINNIVTGAVQPKINQANMNGIKLAVPVLEKVKLFDLIINPIFEKKITNTFQIQTLTKTRDSLLPKLMNGQLRVKV